MTEEEVLRFFDSLPVDQRLRIMQRMLSDMEKRVSRAREELAGIALSMEPPNLQTEVGQLDLPGIEIPIQNLAPARAPTITEDEWAHLDLPDITGGQAHAVHSLRLLDAAEQYERLLKHYGYVRRQPGLSELARRHREKAANTAKETGKSEWAGWVAKDQDTLDRPKTQDWSNWVVSGDDFEDD